MYDYECEMYGNQYLFCVSGRASPGHGASWDDPGEAPHAITMEWAVMKDGKYYPVSKATNDRLSRLLWQEVDSDLVEQAAFIADYRAGRCD